MADISVDVATNDIVIVGGDLQFTSDTGFTETMRQRIRAVLLTFLGEWFLDDPTDPSVGVPYFQSLFSDKIPTLELADSIFRTQLVNIEGVTSVQELSFDADFSSRNLAITFRVTIGIGDETDIIEDIVSFSEIIY
jgi:hypothetical protein